MTRLALRWTVGDVSERGFRALNLSVRGAHRLFGAKAEYAICFNSLPLALARDKAGDLPPAVRWHDSTGQVPQFFKEHFDRGMAEGVGWKLAPLRLFPEQHELALDNDCILWAVPPAIERWLASDDPRACVLAEDVVPAFGKFARLCSPEPRNSGIRGLAPGFDLEGALRETLAANPVALTSELDEQGLQVAALERHARVELVTTSEVSICSPFKPHLPDLGTHGAHFVGLNARRLPWEWDGRNGADHIAGNFDGYLERLESLVRGA